jgi:uncharacterized protein with von Willebrand factor type A (vWA) domain
VGYRPLVTFSTVPAVAAPDLADVASRLGALLQAAGVPVTPERSGRLAATMSLTAPATNEELYWVARITLLADHADIDIFDRVFAQIFGGMVDPADFRGDQAPPPAAGAPGETRPHERRSDNRSAPTMQPEPRRSALGDGGDDDPVEQETVAAVLSADEHLRSKDFATLTPDELVRLRALTGRMAFATPPRRSRRRIRSAHGQDLDVRATLRRARRTGGEPLVAVHRRHRSRPRRLVLISDISGSMEPYARAYLQLLMSGVDGARAEAFVFATRLTRLTRSLRGVMPTVALERAGRAAPDWSGGTRIGDALKAVNDDHGQRGLARGAVVVVLSDGWDCGDPAVLGREMARLRRLAFRVVWVNPRKAAPRYAPLAAGMAAALPHVDAFVSGHSLAAFDEVLDAIAVGEPGSPRPARR